MGAVVRGWEFFPWADRVFGRISREMGWILRVGPVALCASRARTGRGLCAGVAGGWGRITQRGNARDVATLGAAVGGGAEVVVAGSAGAAESFESVAAQELDGR
jgi:hypothetical protein